MKKLSNIILCMLLIILITGCTSQGPKVSEPVINKNLPTPKKIKTISDVNSIAFEWDRITNPNVKGFVVFRGETKEDNLKKVAQIPSRFATHYVDMGLKPNSSYIYRIASFDKDDLQSRPSKNVLVKTADVPKSISFISKVDKLPRLAKIIFRPHPNSAITKYLIERRTPVDKKWKEVATIDGRLNAEYIDYDLDDEKVYEYRIFAIRFDGIKSKPSKVVSTITKKLPDVIQTVGATNNLPKKIVISWQQLPNENELAYYVYVSDFKDGPFTKIAEVKNKGEYTHNISEDGKVNFYKVTAVDKDMLESLMQQIPAQGSTKPKPFAPIIVKAEIINQKPHIKWSEKTQDIAEYRVIRKKGGMFGGDGVEFTGIKSTSFDDTSEGFQPNVEFVYQVIAIDKDGLESDPSEEIALTNLQKQK
jgi:fibronectin type 3 domain-containing protein